MGWWQAVVILVTDLDVPLKMEKFLHYFAIVSFTKTFDPQYQHPDEWIIWMDGWTDRFRSV